MIQKQFLGWMFMLTLASVGCQNNEMASASMEEELPSKSSASRVASDVSVNPYVDTSTYISSPSLPHESFRVVSILITFS